MAVNPRDELSREERDLVLAPNEFAMIQDVSKGNITVWTGPIKTPISQTDFPVVFRNGRFAKTNLDSAVQLFPTASEGSYIVLTNPETEGGKNNHPPIGPSSVTPSLRWGEQINITGPATFSLWPGQTAEVIEGHLLRSNQYLVIRVYDDEKARANWGKAVVVKLQQNAPDSNSEKGEPKPEGDSGNAPEQTPGNTPANKGVKKDTSKVFTLVTGQLLIVKGTDVSFYIPPTGIEVVKDEKGNYVREAVTLEQLEYCILVDENGSKRYERGPRVVFPSPTETFVMDSEKTTRTFRAIELPIHSGLHVKVIAPYEQDGRKYKEGEELFITGEKQQIYFPRPEHAIIKYGGEERIHYGVAIPEGEGRYVLDREVTGAVKLVEGPKMFLPDPRKEVVVRRVLDQKTLDLWYPGNTAASEYNRRLADLAASGGRDFVVDSAVSQLKGLSFKADTFALEAPSAEYRGDEVSRRTKFTPPRTIVLDTKYDGAVAIDVWTGYAVQIVSKTGKRKVVVGPGHVLLKYDETLEVLELSTETPKTDAKLIRTVYLRVNNNKVSDRVDVVTRDLVNVRIFVSYRVNFEGSNEKWFGVENYVKLLTDHIRSLLSNVVKQKGIEEFYGNAIDIIRNAVLGVATEKGARPGRLFTENGMRIYDVEVLKLEIVDPKVSELLSKAQLDAVSQAVTIGYEKRQAETAEQVEEAHRRVITAKAKTADCEFNSKLADEERKFRFVEEEEKRTDEKNSSSLARERDRSKQELENLNEKLGLFLRKLTAESEAAEAQGKAFSPNLIAAITRIADDTTMEEIAKSMGHVTMFSGKSLPEIIAMIASGSQIGQRLQEIIPFLVSKPEAGNKIDGLGKEIDKGTRKE